MILFGGPQSLWKAAALERFDLRELKIREEFLRRTVHCTNQPTNQHQCLRQTLRCGSSEPSAASGTSIDASRHAEGHCEGGVGQKRHDRPEICNTAKGQVRPMPPPLGHILSECLPTSGDGGLWYEGVHLFVSNERSMIFRLMAPLNSHSQELWWCMTA